MHGKFDDNMSFSGNTLTVCGPIFWNGTIPTDLPATRIELLHLCVVQPPPAGPPPYVAAPGLNFTPPTNEWMADVTGNWVSGPVSAHAYVRLVIDNRKRTWIFETWSESITIFAT